MNITIEVPPIPPFVGDTVADLLPEYSQNPALPLHVGHTFRQDCGKASARSKAALCAPGAPTPTELEVCSARTFPEFFPFEIVNLDGCDAAWSAEAAGEWQSVAEAAVAGSTAERITGAVWGPAPHSQPTLQSEAVDLTSSTGVAVSPAVGISILLQAAVAAADGRGLLHIPAPAVPFFEERSLIRPAAGGYRGPNNMPVAVGTGYSGAGPDETGNLDLTANGEWYIGISGPVEFNVGALTPYGADSGPIATGTNRVVVAAHRDAVVRWQSCAAYMVRVCCNEETVCGATLPIDTSGTVAEVLDLVGDDPVLAAQALAIETSKPNPRTTLIEALQEIIDNG